MTTRIDSLFERLGRDGLSRALADCLDQARLVRLANACELKYPGMRTRTQKRARILADLVGRASEPEIRREIHKALKKETSALARRWAKLSDEARAARTADAASLEDSGELGGALFLLASGGVAPSTDGALEALLRAARPGANGTKPAAAESDRGISRDLTRARKKIAQLENKVRHQEGQLTKSRESEKKLRRDLKEQQQKLTDLRGQVQAARRELDAARKAPAAGADADAAAELNAMRRDVRRLATEHRKVHHSLQKDLEQAGRREAAAKGSVRELTTTLDELRREVASSKRLGKKGRDESSAGLESVAAELRELREAFAENFADRRLRAEGSPDRVGVFIDVQNMFYAARQLKGKLDFDALLEAATADRRRILAQAYVVETKEIDQSGFIAVLEQRGIQVRRKTLQVRADGSMKGDWDMEMALDILEEAPHLDVVVLVSGDGDFTSLVHRVKAMGPRVEVYGFPRNTAKALIEAADRYRPLNRRFMIHAPARKKTTKRVAADKPTGETGKGKEPAAPA